MVLLSHEDGVSLLTVVRKIIHVKIGILLKHTDRRIGWIGSDMRNSITQLGQFLFK